VSMLSIKRTWITFVSGSCSNVLQDGPWSPATTSHTNPLWVTDEKCF
jgi:hypothetical protein